MTDGRTTEIRASAVREQFLSLYKNQAQAGSETSIVAISVLGSKDISIIGDAGTFVTLLGNIF